MNTTSKQVGRCYGIRNEHRFDRTGLLKKLSRHERTDPAVLARKALAEIQVILAGGNKVGWFRFSTNGSLPQPKDVTPEFTKALHDLLDFLDEKGIPVHMPVETRRKYNFYRKMVGTRCVVRMSVVSERQFINSPVPCSAVAGTMEMNRKERVQAAKELARKHMEATGKRAYVCPAVADYFLHRRPHAMSKAKCGNCTLCAMPGVNVVYPLH